MTRHCESTTNSNTPDSEMVELPLAMRDLRLSVEPEVVLSSLARASVPAFSDGCLVELSVGVEPLFEVSYPPRNADAAAGAVGVGEDGGLAAGQGGHVVTTPFAMSSAFGRPSCAGLVVHSWRVRVPTPSDGVIARLLVDEALAVLRYERLAEAAAAADQRSAQLAVATITAITIGEATGIVMATRHLTRSPAIDLLTAASRQSHRALHDVAREVVGAGALARLPGEASHPHDADRRSGRVLRRVP